MDDGGSCLSSVVEDVQLPKPELSFRFLLTAGPQGDSYTSFLESNNQTLSIVNPRKQTPRTCSLPTRTAIPGPSLATRRRRHTKDDTTTSGIEPPFLR